MELLILTLPLKNIMNRIPLIFIIILILSGCKTQTEQERLYVFVGEKISVDEVDPTTVDKSWETAFENIFRPNKKRIYRDEAFKCKYRVVQNVFNRLTTDTVEFLAFDHHGIPAFSDYQHALLYISKDGSDYYHQKYQYNAVYLTDDNRWASPGDPYLWELNTSKSVTAVPVKFKQPVTFYIRKYPLEVRAKWYAKPYYTVKGDTAIALMGNYVEELFIVKKEGVLKARGIF